MAHQAIGRGMGRFEGGQHIWFQTFSKALRF